jgi:hypothetical protein
MLYQYPLDVRFKLLALAAKISIKDASKNEVMYIEQNLFAFKEAVRIYNNSIEKKQVYLIKAKQVIDFGAEYVFYKGADETTSMGSVKEEGLRSIFKATYHLLDTSGQEKYTIKEENEWTKIIDGILSQIPIVGIFAGYFFNPVYNVIHAQTKQPVIILRKVPSFWERQFRIEIVDQNLSQEDETSCLLGLIMMVHLQKNRG